MPLKPLSVTEENYLKAIYKLAEKMPEKNFVSTNAIAQQMQTAAASVTDMIQRLNEKTYVRYQKYKGAKLTEKGNSRAKQLLRKHRLWEVFLLEKLHFTWDEVHDIAEQLEHIQSEDLTNRLDAFLNYPKFDPHGDPIPDAEGNVQYQAQQELSELQLHDTGIIVGVKEHQSAFLQYLAEQQLVLGTKVQLVKRFSYDQSLRLLVNGELTITISHQVSKNLFVQKMSA